MNLNENPKIEDLKEIIASSDHRLGHHILWVGLDGTVHLSGPFDGESRARWMTEYRERRALRFETLSINSDYVGRSAANDDDYVRHLFNGLLSTWKKWLSSPRRDHYVDYY